ncbi:class I SAM-dependent methyltransferase [Streptomyces xanthochromogenes]|uniref:class I SAM-dependent methyltransferase n=1 Tax=Streptomyces xanthochromogenes TaxID=67384 RepID=UPI003441DC76
MKTSETATVCGRCQDDVAHARCRVCGRTGMSSVLCLGRVPLANEFVPPELAPSPSHPLHLLHCDDCALAQLARSLSPEELFVEYAYFSSAAAPVLEHGRRLRAFVGQELAPESGGLVVEIGSNDGYLLRSYAADGYQVLGVDPARNVTPQARANGVRTLDAFFSRELAAEMRRSYGPACLIHANNVIAHTPDVVDVLSGLQLMLVDGGGAAVIEVPYLKHLVERGLFDTIYHEHVFYYSFTALYRLLKAAGLTAVHVTQTAFHGGSLRIVARAHPQAVSPSVEQLLREEAEACMTDISYYADFAAKVEDFLAATRKELHALAAAGYSLAGIGAPAKAAIMMSATDAPLKYISDTTPYKQGKCLPGTSVPVVAPDLLSTSPPDYCVIFPWNYADAIIEANGDYLRGGGSFIKPIDFRLEYITARHP